MKREIKKIWFRLPLHAFDETGRFRNNERRSIIAAVRVTGSLVATVPVDALCSVAVATASMIVVVNTALIVAEMLVKSSLKWGERTLVETKVPLPVRPKQEST